MGLFDGLAKFGIVQLNTDDLYVDKDEQNPKEAGNVEKVEVPKEKPKVNEKDFIFEKAYECPVCEFKFKEMTVKTSRARVVKIEKNLRPICDGIEPIKYEMISCPMCGYTTMNRYFGPVIPRQKQMFIDSIGRNYPGNKYYKPGVISFDTAIERIELALATAMVKMTRDSEKAYICLKGKWLCEAYIDVLLEEDPDNEELIKTVKEKGKEFHEFAYEGLIKARQSESFPIAGMDSVTLDYLLAEMAAESGKYDVASKLISSLLQNQTIPKRIKDKTRYLKDEIIDILKNNRKASE